MRSRSPGSRGISLRGPETASAGWRRAVDPGRDARSGRLLPRADREGPPLRRGVLRRGRDHRRVLPAGVPGADAGPEPVPVLRPRRRGRARRVPGLLPVPARGRARRGRGRCGAPPGRRRGRPHRRRRAQRRLGRRPGRRARGHRPPSAPGDGGRPRGLAGLPGPDPAAGGRQAAAPRHPPAGDRGRVRGRVRERAPVQRGVPRRLRATAVGGAAGGRRGRGGAGRPPRLPAAAGLGRADRVPRGARGARRRAGRRRGLPADDRGRRRPGRGVRAPRPGPARAARRAVAGAGPARGRDRGPPAPAVRPRRPTRRGRGPPRRRPPARPAGPAPARAAGAGRVRRLRGRGPRGPRPAGLGRRGDDPRRRGWSTGSARLSTSPPVRHGPDRRFPTAAELARVRPAQLAVRDRAAGDARRHPGRAGPRRRGRRDCARSRRRRRARPRRADCAAGRAPRRSGRGPRTTWRCGSCGWPDAFPSGDLVVRRALGASTARAAEAEAEAWRPWRAYAAIHLWAASAAASRRRTA